jgi:hypothetical protein
MANMQSNEGILLFSYANKVRRLSNLESGMNSEWQPPMSSIKPNSVLNLVDFTPKEKKKVVGRS